MPQTWHAHVPLLLLYTVFHIYSITEAVTPAYGGGTLNVKYLMSAKGKATFAQKIVQASQENRREL